MGPQASRSYVNKQPWLIIHGNGQLDHGQMKSTVLPKVFLARVRPGRRGPGQDVRSQVTLDDFTSRLLPTKPN